jgi:phenylpropionate dioxygenase-like ring-hydroxylating dioxygenase large terminal subunit
MAVPVGSLCDLVRPGEVHRRCYTDSELFDLEMSRIFGGRWTYLGHESQLPEPGSYLTARLGRRPIVLLRGLDGEIRALLNRCMHRGTVICTEPSGRASGFVCPYHGWSYDTAGRLLGVPYPAEYGPSFDRSTRGLRAVPRVESRAGFLFGTLHPGSPSLADWLGSAGDWIDHFTDRAPHGNLTISPVPLRLRFRANWKVAWDNAADGLHATFVHRSYNQLGELRDRSTVLARDPGETPMYSIALGNGHQVVDQRPHLHAGFWDSQRPVPFSESFENSLRDRLGPAEAAGWLELATGAMVNLSIFPNLIFVGNQIMVVEPESVDQTTLTLWLMVSPDHPEEVNGLRLRVEEDFTNFGNPDDLAMFERVQAGLAIEEIEWVDISRGLHAEAVRGRSDGTVVGPITSEAPTRGFWRAWVEALTDERVLEVT